LSPRPESHTTSVSIRRWKLLFTANREPNLS